ncbi:MAG: DUF3667 domain-containing protein [Phyllobacterium sp.]
MIERRGQGDGFRRTENFFEAAICRNCGAPLETKFCPACGQKKAERFDAAHLRDEAWEKVRWFEADMLKAAFNVVLRPGKVARDYVLGKRKSHVHPLKLLLAAIVLLLLTIARTGYLSSSDATLNKAIALVQAYSKWSFSLGIVAVLIASNLVFRFRRNFNFVEHLVLATYTHFVIIVANIVNLSPLLFHSSPELLAAHRTYTGYYMDWVEAGIVFLAFGQFFAIDWRRQWWWPAIGAAVFYAAKEGLFYLYARAVIRIVLAQLA